MMNTSTLEHAPTLDRLDKRLLAWLKAVRRYLGQYWTKWTTLIAGILLFNAFFTLGFNITHSLPGHVYLIKKWERNDVINKGNIVAFRWHGGGKYDPYPAGFTFMKVVRGLPGDVVTVQGREFFVNGQSVGVAKQFTGFGHHPLAMGKTGVIPPGVFYAWAPNPDSLDSRYAITGWIPFSVIKGKAVCLF
jgi:conjugal transfer pilin signal peptidase TrbI